MPGSHLLVVSTAPWQDQVAPTTPAEPPPCVVDVEYADGYTGTVAGHALAWTDRAVQVLFRHPDPTAAAGLYRVWLPLQRVRRPGPGDPRPGRLYPPRQAAVRTWTEHGPSAEDDQPDDQGDQAQREQQR